MDADWKFRLFPAIVGVFTSIEVVVFPTTLQAPILKLDIDALNAKIMVFQINKNTCESAKCSASEYLIYFALDCMFISGGKDNELLLSGCLTRAMTIQMSTAVSGLRLVVRNGDTHSQVL